MSLFGSLFSGVSGLNAQSRAMGIISDNVANVNTTAFKGSLAQFTNLVTRQKGAASFSPGGVRAQGFQTISSPGPIQSTASPTDAAISGPGFFVVDSAADGSGEQLYTRAGSFNPDYAGNLRTASGFFLRGWALDANEEIIDPSRLDTVNVHSIDGLAAATTAVKIKANLNADQTVYDDPANLLDYDPANNNMAEYNATGGTAGVKPSFTRSFDVYDSLGRAHKLTFAFLRTDDPATGGTAANEWAVEVYGDAAELADPPHADGLLAAGRVSFNGDGTLQAISPVFNTPVNIEWNAASGAAASTITFDLGTLDSANGLSQFASPSDVAFVTQNGAEVGELNGVSIDENGFVIASFTNGEERRLYKLPIATFANPASLDPRSGNVFAQTDASGSFNLHIAGTGGAGVVTPSALEASNVDLAEEFTKMIVTQRAYSANAKIINTTDQMLEELIRLNG